MKFDHIGVFVKNINDGVLFFSKIITISQESKIYDDYNLGVSIKFLHDSDDICYELISPLTENNPVINSLNKKVNILNHLAYTSSDFSRDVIRIKNSGAIQITEISKAIAFNNKKVVFFLSPLNFIIELIDDNY